MSTTSSSVPTWKTEFDERVAAFAKAIGVDEKKVREALAELGVDGQTDQSLIIIDSESYLPMQDLFAAFVDTGLTQKAKLRLALTHLRGQTHLSEAAPSTNGGETNSGGVVGAIKDMIAASRPKADWTDEELLKAYDETSTEIWKILRERSHGRPFIVYNGDGSVNVTVSLKLLRIAKKQPTTDRHMVDGKAVRVYRSGEFLAKLVDESPFFPGVALVDGYCAKSNTQWDGVAHEARVIVRLHVQKVENKGLSQREMREIAKIASAGRGVAAIREELPDAALMYDELKEQDALPKLKIDPRNTRPEPYTGKVDTGL